ncbi:MAG: hypothetical protein BGO69_13340 [Bacteroidetes bacterium 46-16]|nr:MAG: hypothetical protein BGO69_13340 [Bacteroidetes bacterium 46-16]
MAANRLHDDLLVDFKDQKELINEQIKIFEPIAESLSRPAAIHLLGQGTLIVMEIVCYLLFLAAIAATILVGTVFPFHMLDDIYAAVPLSSHEVRDSVVILSVVLRGLVIFIGFLFLLLAFNISSIRKKNKILSVAGKHLKTLVGQHLRRKAAIDTIEQRHFVELPEIHVNQRINEIPNPGYGE